MAPTPKDNNSKLNANKSSNNGCKTISSNNFINIVPTLMWLLNTPLTIKKQLGPLAPFSIPCGAQFLKCGSATNANHPHLRAAIHLSLLILNPRKIVWEDRRRSSIWRRHPKSPTKWTLKLATGRRHRAVSRSPKTTMLTRSAPRQEEKRIAVEQGVSERSIASREIWSVKYLLLG